MSKEATKNQIADILAKEKKRLGLDAKPTDEQLLYRKAESIVKEVVSEGRMLLEATKSSGLTYDREMMKTHMQKQFMYKYVNSLSKEEMAFLLSVMHVEETISSVET